MGIRVGGGAVRAMTAVHKWFPLIGCLLLTNEIEKNTPVNKMVNVKQDKIHL